jgi:hypothetical protein
MQRIKIEKANRKRNFYGSLNFSLTSLSVRQYNKNPAKCHDVRKLDHKIRILTGQFEKSLPNFFACLRG